MSRAPRRLTEEDRILWSQVAATAVPLFGHRVELISEPEPPPPVAASTPAAPPARPSRAEPHRLHALDQPTRRKLAKGRLAVDAKIDLHGLTQSEAHGMLLGFLHAAHLRGLRFVLVVTGKGASFGSEGALKRAVPGWLATPVFRAVVSGYDEAVQRHGGTGALYVRLRRGERP